MVYGCVRKWCTPIHGHSWKDFSWITGVLGTLGTLFSDQPLLMIIFPFHGQFWAWEVMQSFHEQSAGRPSKTAIFLGLHCLTFWIMKDHLLISFMSICDQYLVWQFVIFYEHVLYRLMIQSPKSLLTHTRLLSWFHPLDCGSNSMWSCRILGLYAELGHLLEKSQGPWPLWPRRRVITTMPRCSSISACRG